MKTMKLGKTGIDISRMGLGTWSIGGGSAWGGDHDLQVVVDTIREAPKLGVNLIDTAPGYNFGNSEKILGKALEGMNREDVVIITKCGVTWDQEMKGDLFNKVNGIQLYKNLNSASIKREIEESLKRMGTDYVDVYMTHWQSIEGSEYYVPIQKTMEVLNDLKAQGKIKAIGAANVDIKRFRSTSSGASLISFRLSIQFLTVALRMKSFLAVVKTVLQFRLIHRSKWDFSRVHSQEITSLLAHRFQRNGSSPKICRRLWMLWISGSLFVKNITVQLLTLLLHGFLLRATLSTFSAVLLL